MSSPLLAALAGRCPACRSGRLYERFLMLHELCPACGVRFEREVSTRTIATILSFGVGAGLAFGARGLLTALGAERGALLPIGVALGGVIYPLFRSVAVFLLWQNGLVTVDVPEEPRRRSPRPAPLDAPAPLGAGPDGFAHGPIVALPIPDPDEPSADGPRGAGG